MVTKKLLRNINLSKKYVENVLIVGGGRWAEVHYNEIKKIKNIKKIDFFSIYNKNYLQKNYSKNKTAIYSDVKKLNKLNYDYVIIATRSKNQKFFLDSFLKKNNHILCEKPYLLGKKYYLKILNSLNKRNYNFFISSPWLHNLNLIKISKYLKNQEFDQIRLFWLDKKNQKKYGRIKRFDRSYPYSIDIITHIYSIIRIVSPTTYNYFKSSKIFDHKMKKNYELIKCKNTKLNTFLKFSRDSKKNLRKLILSNKKLNYTINFNKKSISIFKNSVKINSFKENNNEIFLQHKYMIDKNKNNYKFDFECISIIDKIKEAIK